MIGPIPYIGGKSRLFRQIIALFPEHTTYVEPFAGGAQVFFRKERSPVEVLNDLDGELVNFYRCCQNHYEELVRYLRYSLISRKWFELLKATPPETLTDIQRAARLFLLQKQTYGGLIIKQHYHYGVTQRPNFNPARIPELIEETHNRLQHVQLECLPYEEMFQRYDRPSTLFFIDPPYWGPKLYKFNLADSDFGVLARRVSQLKGRFILSLNDRPEVREVFSEFRFHPVTVAYSAQRQSEKRFNELLICNFGAAGEIVRNVTNKALSR